MFAVIDGDGGGAGFGSIGYDGGIAGIGRMGTLSPSSR
jgi:hypothetical protein